MPRKITGPKLALAMILLIATLPVLANDGIDTRINEAVKPFADTVAGVIFTSFPQYSRHTKREERGSLHIFFRRS